MSPVDVLLLTQARCDFCDGAKALFERLGSDFELRVSELDLRSPDGRRIAESHGVLFAPGILLDGELVSYGRPSERRLRSELCMRFVKPDRIPRQSVVD